MMWGWGSPLLLSWEQLGLQVLLECRVWLSRWGTRDSASNRLSGDTDHTSLGCPFIGKVDGDPSPERMTSTHSSFGSAVSWPWVSQHNTESPRVRKSK